MKKRSLAKNFLVGRAASAQFVSTLAGSGVTGSMDGAGSQATFGGPKGLSVDPRGNVYVADTSSLKIRRVAPGGFVATVAGDGSAGYGDGIGAKTEVFGPFGIAGDAFGNVWVTDQDDGIGEEASGRVEGKQQKQEESMRLRRGTLHFQIRMAMIAIVLVAAASVAGAADPTISVVADGLNNPRGLTFGPDGDLYVAEGGTGGSMTTSPAQCAQVPAPVGPYSGGFTARISRISSTGVRSTVVDGLPSSQTSPAQGSLASGVADVAFIGHHLYALLAGAGCSHGLVGTANAILRVNTNGTTTQVANLSAYQKANPVAHPEPDDFEPDGTWYSMVAVDGDLYALEPNHGEIVRVSPESGKIRRVVDVSASQGHIVPTALAHHGKFFFGNLGTFPIVPGSEGVFKLTSSGHVEPWASGLTTVLGLAFDDEGRLYVLESMTAAGFPGPDQIGTGKIVRIGHGCVSETIATGLSFPTGMTFGPDGALYVSNLGFAGPGAGQILRVPVPE